LWYAPKINAANKAGLAMRPYLFICAVLFVSLLDRPGAGANEPKLERFSYEEPHMGTKFRIILYASDKATADKASKAAFERIAELDRIMSDYKATSELMQLCAKAGGEPTPVSDELFVVLNKAQEVSNLSDGAFDVTVGPVVRLWRKARRTGKLPDPEQLSKARELIGYKMMHLDAKKHTVQLEKAGMQLDLGGIAKGYAGDEVQAVLKKHGITRALVAAGGDIVVSGPPPDADGWSIEIEAADDEDGKPRRTLILNDAGVSTSGEKEQYIEIDGKRYSHIVDPHTGIGIIGQQSVTVIAPNGITADSMTKVVMILGTEKGVPILENLNGASCLVVRKTGKGYEVVSSKRFPKN
jgi:thiamine biosynthesis lipoprotein